MSGTEDDGSDIIERKGLVGRAERALCEADGEIRRLRQENEVLRGKCEVVAIFGLALQGREGGWAAAPDVLYSIGGVIKEMREAAAAKAQADAAAAKVQADDVE